MYDSNAQSSLIKLRNELKECSYEQSMKDYLSNMIIRIMNYPKKRSQSRYYIKEIDQKKIMMILYPMSVPFMNKNYNIPIQIYIMKNIPYEPPQIFLEVVQGSAANANNKDIDQNNNRIMTKTLRTWNQYSNIETVLEEIFESFSKVFPLYKKKSNQQKPSPNQNNGEYNGIQKNQGNNSFQTNNYNNNYNQLEKYGYKPPTKNIYGKAMTNEENKNYQPPSLFGGGIYENNNNNDQQNTSFCGGFHGNNNHNNIQQSSSIGVGINDNNSNHKNNQQPNSPGVGIYGYNNNNNNSKQNAFGEGGIYENNNNKNNENNIGSIQNDGFYDFTNKRNENNNGNNQNDLFYDFTNKRNENNNGNKQNNGFYDFTNKKNENNNINSLYDVLNDFINKKNENDANKYDNSNTQPEYADPPQFPLVDNVDEDLKNILLEEVFEKISNKLIEEKKRLNYQNKKMEEYKDKFYKENEKLKNFLDDQMQIKFKCEEDMTNLKNAIRKVKDYNDNNQIIIVDEENCLDYLDIPNNKAIKIIADEACMEEIVLIVRKGFEKKKISFDEALVFMRNSSRDLFAIKFLKEKEISNCKF